MVTRPLSGCTRLSMDLMVVLLPAPLRPMKPMMVPGALKNYFGYDKHVTLRKRSYYGTTGATHITPFTVSGSVLTKLKKSGAVIQGFGVIMTKVVIIDKPNTAISTITNSPTPSRIYNLRGVEVKKPRRGEVYIVGGKKILY